MATGYWFNVTKKEVGCTFCPATIMAGETIAMMKIPRQNGSVDLKIGHVACFRRWLDAEFVRKLLNYEMGKVPRPEKKRQNHYHRPLGKPRLYDNPFLAARLRSRIAYHKGIPGHEQIVLDATLELEMLKKRDYSSMPDPEFKQ